MARIITRPPFCRPQIRLRLHGFCNVQHLNTIIIFPLCGVTGIPSRFLGCFGQQYLSVEVVPLNTTSVQATFIPPSPETYTLHYVFGNGAPMSEEITVSTTDPQTRVLTDATADPGTLVRVQVNSTLPNFIYPTTQARTCTAGRCPGRDGTYVMGVFTSGVCDDSIHDPFSMLYSLLWYMVIHTIYINMLYAGPFSNVGTLIWIHLLRTSRL